ncbi:MAG TPA: hypothetical protein VFN38_09965 [Gemmatimonadaceae bacterium]|nr:hypothetical protein [Gemmatimonadaceae bacterium]
MSGATRSGKVPVPVLVTLGIGAVLAVLVAWPPSQPRGGGRAPAAQQDSTARPDTGAAVSPNLPAPEGQTDPPVGEFYYLVDISASTKDVNAASAFMEGIALLQPIFGALREMKELSPQRHRVATIGAMSLQPAPRCDIHVAAQTLFSADDNPALATRAMGACERELRQLTPEQHTDISGALVNAGLSLQGKRKALRGVLLITDLEEDIQPGAVAGRPDLRGMCVAVFTLVTPASARDPRLLNERSSEWTAKLRGWGAKNVYAVNARGIDATDLRGFFQSCEG